MNKNIFLIILLLFGWSQKNFADPIDPNVKKKLTLKDGTTVECRMSGNEYNHYWIDADDNLYLEDTSTGTFFKTNRAEIRRRATIKKAPQNFASSKEPFTPIKGMTGKQRILTILVEFPNAKFKAGHDAQLFNKILNSKDYKDNGFDGSVHDYFYDQSNGQFDLSFDIAGPFMMPEPYEYYGMDRGDNTNNTYEMVKSAIKIADSYVDYSQYVWKNMDEVSPINIIYAGFSESSSGESNNIWSACTTVEDYLDGVRLSKVAYSSELRRIGKEERLCGIGTMCHELSHGFGLPDIYDQTTGNYGTQNWDLMDIGCHGNNGITPSGMTAYDKYSLGWIEPIVLHEDTEITNMRPTSESGQCYKIQNSCHKNEFYLLEYRDQKKWDKYLSGHGLLIMHVDYDKYLFDHNIVNKTGPEFGNDHERCRLILADNDPTITNESYKGDLWPYKNNNALTATSTPAAIVFNQNVDGSYFMHKDITNIRESNGTMSFTFTNHIDKQYYGLTGYNDSIQFTSESSFKYELGLHNTQNRTFDQKLKFVLCKKKNDKYQEIKTLTENVIVDAFSHTKYSTHFNNITLDDDSNAEYYVLSYYQNQKDKDSWQLLRETLVNTNMRHKNFWTFSDNYQLIVRDDNSAAFIIDITNQSFKESNTEISLFTYVWEDGHYVIQKQRASAYPHLGAYDTQKIIFELTDLEQDKEYYGFLYYFDKIKEDWIQLSYSYQIVVNESSIAASRKLDKNINRLSALNSTIQIASESTIRNKVDILNKKGDTYNQALKMTLCKSVNGKYEEIQSITKEADIVANSISTISEEFSTTSINDLNAQYYIISYYKPLNSSEYWQQLTKTKVNTKTLDGNSLTASDEYQLIVKDDNTASLTIKITNNSYLDYDESVSIYTAFPGVSGWQKPRAFVKKHIDAFSTEEYTFELTDLERNKEYIANLFFIPKASAGWEIVEPGSAYSIIVNDSTIALPISSPNASIQNEEYMVYSLNGTFIAKINNHSEISQLKRGVYIIKRKNGSTQKQFVK